MPRLPIFNAPTIDQTALQLANACPQGRAWGNKNSPDSNMYKFIASMAKGFNIVQQQIEHLAKEMNLGLTQDLLPEWESSVRLPDECKNTLTDLDERRNAIITQLKNKPVVTKAEYEALGYELIGETVTVTAGWDYEEATAFPDNFSRFKLYVQFVSSSTGFPYSFPYPFGGFRSDIVECVFNKITPAPVVVILV